MFLECLEMIFDSLESVVKALDVDIFTVGTVGVSFWELILGLLTLGIIFGFFLAPRMGSGLGGIGNINEYQKSQREARQRAEEKAYNNSFMGYARNRWVKENYNYQYNQMMNKNALKEGKGKK